MFVNNYISQMPVKVATVKLGIPKSYKEQCIKEAYIIGDTQNNQTNLHATMSDWMVFEQTKVFDKLLSKITYIINDVILSDITTHRFSIVDTWTAIYKTNDFARPHTHHPFHFSFVYYLQSPQPSTPLDFHQSDFSIYPEEDMLIVFPSYLPHKVPKHTHKEDRICLSGNLIFDGIKPNSATNNK